MSKKIGLSSPIVVYVKKLQTFFAEDPDICVEYDENDPDSVNITVGDPEKFYALSSVMESEVEFGNLHLSIYIWPADLSEDDKTEMFKKLFKDSSIVSSIDEIKSEGTSNKFTYISFRNQVVKYWADNLGNPHGNAFTLFETVANDIFENHDGVFFTTAEE